MDRSAGSLILVAVFIILLLGYYIAPEKRLPADAKINKMIVYKSTKKMDVYGKTGFLKTYQISISRKSGKKKFDDDDKTPEGGYKIDSRDPRSGFYKSLHISYPDKADIRNAEKHGKKAGGGIEIHGLKNGLGFIGKFHRLLNWTRGCIAVTNGEMDELYRAVDKGTEIEIRK